MSHLVSAYKLPKSHPYERPLAIINPKLSYALTSSTACGTNRALALMRISSLARIPPASRAAFQLSPQSLLFHPTGGEGTDSAASSRPGGDFNKLV
ncbi:MAG TPA: hypothetical protein PKZ55_07270 [Verrucomicrobiota bacterium]|nr:hypothetical protein [Verrucomicrobiota bacterium]